MNRLTNEDIYNLMARDINQLVAERNYALRLVSITKRQRNYFLDRIRKRDGKA